MNPFSLPRDPQVGRPRGSKFVCVPGLYGKRSGVCFCARSLFCPSQRQRGKEGGRDGLGGLALPFFSWSAPCRHEGQEGGGPGRQPDGPTALFRLSRKENARKGFHRGFSVLGMFARVGKAAFVRNRISRIYPDWLTSWELIKKRPYARNVSAPIKYNSIKVDEDGSVHQLTPDLPPLQNSLEEDSPHRHGPYKADRP